MSSPDAPSFIGYGSPTYSPPPCSPYSPVCGKRTSRDDDVDDDDEETWGGSGMQPEKRPRVQDDEELSSPPSEPITTSRRLLRVEGYTFKTAYARNGSHFVIAEGSTVHVFKCAENSRADTEYDHITAVGVIRVPSRVAGVSISRKGDMMAVVHDHPTPGRAFLTCYNGDKLDHVHRKWSLHHLNQVEQIFMYGSSYVGIYNMLGHAIIMADIQNNRMRTLNLKDRVDHRQQSQQGALNHADDIQYAAFEKYDPAVKNPCLYLVGWSTFSKMEFVNGRYRRGTLTTIPNTDTADLCISQPTVIQGNHMVKRGASQDLFVFRLNGSDDNLFEEYVRINTFGEWPLAMDVDNRYMHVLLHKSLVIYSRDTGEMIRSLTLPPTFRLPRMVFPILNRKYVFLLGQEGEMCNISIIKGV